MSVKINEKDQLVLDIYKWVQQIVFWDPKKDQIGLANKEECKRLAKSATNWLNQRSAKASVDLVIVILNGFMKAGRHDVAKRISVVFKYTLTKVVGEQAESARRFAKFSGGDRLRAPTVEEQNQPKTFFVPKIRM